MEYKKDKIKKLIDFCDEHINSKVLSKNGDCLALLIALKKNQKMNEHISPTDAFIYIIEGEIEFHLNKEIKQIFEIKKDEIFFFKADEKHSITAKEDTKMLVIRI